MQYETIEIELDAQGIAALRLSRASRHNAMSAQMIAELTQAAARLGADPAVRAVLLTGAGETFCAGADLGWMQEQMSADPQTRAFEAGKLAWMLQALNTLPKPLIGAVQGNAFGGGVGLACVCDVALGADHLKMGLTEVRLGIIPATIGPYVIGRMGEGRARQVFFSGRVFDAHEAVRLGILSRAVPADDLLSAAQAEIAPYLQAAPGAVAAAKELCRSMGSGINDHMIDQSIAALKTRWETNEARDGIAAFFARSKAPWML